MVSRKFKIVYGLRTIFLLDTDAPDILVGFLLFLFCSWFIIYSVGSLNNQILH